MPNYANKLNPAKNSVTRKLKNVQFTLTIPPGYRYGNPNRLTIRTFGAWIGTSAMQRNANPGGSTPALRLSLKEALALRKFLNETL